MAPRSVFTGSISFGLVNVPVALVNVVQPKAIKFSQFTNTGHPVGVQKYDKETGEILAASDVFRGQAVGEQVVFITDDELTALAPTANKTITIEKFVDGTQISGLLYSKDHYAMPQKGGEQAYALLTVAIETTGKVGVGTVVVRDKEHPVAVRVENHVIVVSYLSHDDEVRKVEELVIKDVEVSEAHVAAAVRLIEASAGEFNPADLVDHQRAKVEALVTAKAAGTAVPVGAEEGEGPKFDSLLAALEASIID